MLTTLPPTAPEAEVRETLERDGAVIVADAVDPATVDAFVGDVAGDVGATPPGHRGDDPVWDEFYGERTKRLCSLAARSPRFVDFLLHPTLHACVAPALRPSCGDYRLNTGQLMIVGPGQGAQYLHRDQSSWPYFNPLVPHGPEVTVSSMFALTDFTEEVGATRVVPGSHRVAEADDPYDPAAAVVAEMRRGSLLIWSGRTVHSAGANTTDTWRWGVHVSFCLGWLRSEEAHHLAVPPEVARTLPRRARELLGFAMYAPPPTGGGALDLVDFHDPGPRFTPEIDTEPQEVLR